MIFSRTQSMSNSAIYRILVVATLAMDYAIVAVAWRIWRVLQ
jgi:hypothetical protein